MPKTCCMCKVEKAAEEFSKHARSKDGLQTQCRKCATEYSQRPENMKRRSQQAANRWANGMARDKRYQHLFGITLEDYYRIYFEQNEVCKICGGKQTGNNKNLCVDHCHQTGRIRGLLCSKCNAGIGFLCDNHGLVEKAKAYLAENQTTPGEPNG